MDFSYGHTGSAHDSTAWVGTRLAREHDTILEENEFVWADSAYPVSSVSISRNIKHANIISLARNVGCSTIQKTRKGDTRERGV